VQAPTNISLPKTLGYELSMPLADSGGNELQ